MAQPPISGPAMVRRQLPPCMPPPLGSRRPLRLGSARQSNTDSGFSGSCLFSPRRSESHVTPAVPLGSRATIRKVVGADALPQPFQPASRPRKFEAENCQAYRYEDDGRARYEYHHDAEQKDGAADSEYDDASRQLVGNSYRIHRPGSVLTTSRNDTRRKLCPCNFNSIS